MLLLFLKLNEKKPFCEFEEGKSPIFNKSVGINSLKIFYINDFF